MSSTPSPACVVDFDPDAISLGVKPWHGEKTGRIDEMFEKIATFYEGDVDTAVSRLMKALEPAPLVVGGGILGGTVIALYLPIFELMTHVNS